jgi:hypothetical protein
MYYFHQLSILSDRPIHCSTMSENNERRFYRGSAGWIIIGIIAGVVVILGLIMAFGPIFSPGGPGIATQSETADESATSGPGHNTTAGGSTQLENPEEAIVTNDTVPGAEQQIPDSELSFGRETSTVGTPATGLQGENNTANGTNSGLENPLSENTTSLTGT